MSCTESGVLDVALVGVGGLGLNCVKQKPAVQEIPNLRNDKGK